MPIADTEKPKFRKRLPQSLTNHNLSHGQITFIKSEIGDAYLLIRIMKMNTASDAEISEYISSICPQAEVEDVSVFTLYEHDLRAAFFRFKDKKSEKEWVSAACQKQLHLMDSEAIARLILSSLTTVNTSLGYDITTTDMAKKFLLTHKDQLSKVAFKSKEDYDRTVAEMGLVPAPPGVKPRDEAIEVKQQICKGQSNKLS